MSELGLITGKHFIGTDFLTWLLAAGEARGGEFELPNHGRVSIIFDNKILLSMDSEQVDYRGEISNLEGVRLALRQGMKVLEGKLFVKLGEREWRFTLTSKLLQVKGLKLPKPRYMKPEELWFDRLGYISELTELLDELFGHFLALRLGDAWETELAAIQAWLNWE